MAIHRLILRDFVIVPSLELDIASGFTVLTGETGAGKSILIDAIQMALGERAHADVVREGASKADVAIEFDRTPAVDAWLAESGFETSLEPDEHLLIRLTVAFAVKCRAWINGSAATAAQLRKLAEHLVDIHGQHAWAMLTRADAVRELLDAYAHIDMQPLSAAWETWRSAKAALEQARASAGAQDQARERLQWQISEVGKLAPLAGEWQELGSEHARLSHAQSLIDAAQQAMTALDGGEGGHGSHGEMRDHAASLIHRALQGLQAQSHIEQGFAAICEELESSLVQIRDASRSLQAYLRRLDLDPVRLAQLDARMVDWLSLARRFKCAPDALHDTLANWQASLAELNAQSDGNALEASERAAYTRFMAAAQQVSAKRQEAAPRLAAAITSAMQELGMQGGQFQVALSTLDAPAAYGLESTEFLVAGHSGTQPKPIAKVASGGELSRIALAIAVTTSQLGSAPTLIFDEIDSGIGGATAQTVGKLMKQLGRDRQVLAVTHLAQVASKADHHGVVSKVHGATSSPAANQAPYSHIDMVSANARVREIARMLGGGSSDSSGTQQSEAALQHAQEMLSLA